jgi:hypothetical protein
MKRISSGSRGSKFVNDSTSEAIIGSAAKRTKPMMNGDTNRSPVHPSPASSARRGRRRGGTTAAIGCVDPAVLTDMRASLLLVCGY